MISLKFFELFSCFPYRFLPLLEHFKTIMRQAVKFRFKDSFNANLIEILHRLLPILRVKIIEKIK